MTATKTRGRSAKQVDLAELLDKIVTAEPRRVGSKCSVAKFIDGLPEEFRAPFLAQIEDESKEATVVAEELSVLPGAPAPFTIRRHRKRHKGTGCKCP